jgi:hypothetical protein
MRRLPASPTQANPLRAQVKVQMAQEHWIEAAITANQFTLAAEETPITLRRRPWPTWPGRTWTGFAGTETQSLTQNLISNLITGAASYLLTGGLSGRARGP